MAEGWETDDKYICLLQFKSIHEHLTNMHAYNYISDIKISIFGNPNRKGKKRKKKKFTITMR